MATFTDDTDNNPTLLYQSTDAWKASEIVPNIAARNSCINVKLLHPTIELIKAEWIQ